MEPNSNLAFTEYVRALKPGGPLPDPSLFEAFYAKLASALVAEMKKRSLWSVSPGYLGVHGAAVWSEAALEDLLSDLYTFILDRLPSLRAQLEVKDNVEGLIFRNLHNYLYDTQRKYDPVGFRAYELTRTAVRDLIVGTRLHVLSGDEHVSNDTVVGFAPSADFSATASPVLLGPVVRAWNDDLLPELVTARGKKKGEVASRLADAISRLPGQGILSFRFKDLIDPLKSDVRQRWSALLTEGAGKRAVEKVDDEPVLVVQVEPDRGVEERDAFDKLLACLAEALDEIPDSSRTREHLERLWTYLRDHAAAGDDEKTPSRRQIAQALGIPRDRLPGLLATLGRWIEECREPAEKVGNHFRAAGGKGL